MTTTKQKIGLGGSCHWCTEAIFQSLIGVQGVEQGWIAAKEKDNFSEAVIVTFDSKEISLAALIEIHLYTHSCTANHSMRTKYRSAIYCFHNEQISVSQKIINDVQNQFEEKIVTQTLTFNRFKLNKEEQLNYYYSNPEKPFCTNVINPKLKLILSKFSEHINNNKLAPALNYETPKT